MEERGSLASSPPSAAPGSALRKGGRGPARRPARCTRNFSSLGLVLGFRGSGPIQRPESEQMPAFRPTFSGSQGGPHSLARGRLHTPRPAPCAADSGYRHSHAGIQMGQRTAEGTAGSGEGSGGLGRGLWGETHHGSEEFAHAILTARARDGGKRGRK